MIRALSAVTRRRGRVAFAFALLALVAAVASPTNAGAAGVVAPAFPDRPDTVVQPQGGGGPDAFGYTWAISTDAGGPVFDWIDISTTGTLVTGLADDNASASIALPFPFRFYWADATQMRIGSNGWIAFDNVSNIASCFPGIPGAGGPGDNYVAPLMSDLNFTGAGNPGTVRYLIDVPNQRVIVSYLAVPFWIVGAPGFTGSNTFQVILDAATRKVKFQYQTLSAFQANAACNDLVGGIESPTGTIGLQTFLDALPANNVAIEFTYPAVPLIDVVDPSPQSVANVASAGEFVPAVTGFTPTAVIANSGNAATTGPVTVTAQLLDAASTPVYSATANIPSLAAGEEVDVTFTPDATPVAGHYTLRVQTSGGGDINANNNQRDVDIVAIPFAADGVQLDYVGTVASNARIDWNATFTGADTEGAAILIELPEARVVTSLSAFVADNGAGAGFKLKLVDNDGPDGLPGTTLAEVQVPPGGAVTGAWNTVAIPATGVDTDGFYVVWIDQGNIGLGATTTGAPSRRSYELIGGTFAAYRDGGTTDPMLRATVSRDEVFSNGFE